MNGVNRSEQYSRFADPVSTKRGEDKTRRGAADFGAAIADGVAAVASVAVPVATQLATTAVGGLGAGPVGTLASNLLGGGGGVSEGGQQAALLQLQQQINQDNLRWTTLTNVEKSVSDTRKSIVQNIRP